MPDGETVERWSVIGFVDDILENVLGLPAVRDVAKPLFPRSVIDALGLPKLSEIGKDIAKRVEERGKRAASGVV